MKKSLNWQILLGLGLIALSAALYYVHYLIFRDAHHIFIYLLGDIAFVPIEVLLVTIIIHQLLNLRERNDRMEKMNMVIGAFFSEAGTALLSKFSAMDRRLDDLKEHLLFKSDAPAAEFDRISKYLNSHSYEVVVKSEDIESIKALLAEKRAFLLRLLENPNLLEHESFTDLLWATFHLAEELESRAKFTELPAKDMEHIAGDIKRAYALLVREWVNHLKHLRSHYPYLFSLALRTNPFDAKASVILK
jgi:hypothetical protein